MNDPATRDPAEEYGDPEEPADPIGDVPDDEYGSRVRFSRLKLLAKSPAHYLANPQGESEALERGTAVHAVLLGGRRVIVWDKKTEPTKKSKGGKQAPRNGGAWDAFKAANPGATILLPGEYETVMRMVDAVRANRDAMHILTGVVEDTILFDMLGLECRTTPDVRAHDGSFYTELKTCRSSDPFRFGFQTKQMSYHGQMAMHREGIRRAKLGPASHGYVVAVESTLPHPVTVFRVTDHALEKGDKQIRFWMERLKGCIQSGQWPPYAQSVVDLDVPDDEIELSGAIPGDADPEDDDIPF